MARFTSTAPLNIRWLGNDINGAAGATHRIPDALYDEFNAAYSGVIPGLTWVTQDEASATAGFDPATKYDKTGGTISGAVTVTGALVAQSTVSVVGAATFGSVIASAVTATSARFKGGPWFDVKAYGAAGDGATDDTVAINAAITALDAAGRGVLYFPPGRYLTTGGHLLPSNTTILGAGAGTPNDYNQYVSLISCTSATAVLFNFTGPAGRVERIALDNSSAGATAGAGVVVSNAVSYFLQSVDFEAVRISRFYVGADIQVGTAWTMRGCTLYQSVLYNVKIRNTQVADSGDWAISDSEFIGATGTSASIRIESSGGGRISNCKINNGVHGIDLAVGSAVETGILIVANNSIENVTGIGVRGTTAAGTSTWRGIIIQGNQFGLWSSTGGNAISLISTTAADFADINISDNVFNASGTPGVAIVLTKVARAHVGRHPTYIGFTGLLTTTTCTYVTGDGTRDGLLSALTAAISIANTSTTVVEGSIPSGFIDAGTTIRFTAYGRLTSGVTGGDSTFSIRIGPSAAFIVSLAITNAASKTNAPFRVDGLATFRAAGSSGSVMGELSVYGGTEVVPFTLAGNVTAISSAVAVDTSGACPVYLTYVSGNAGTTATFEIATIETI